MRMDRDSLLRMYRKMFEIRTFEEKLYYLYLNETMPGAMHQCTGQEAAEVGVCENLRKDDYVVSCHRGHGHYIAKGGDINKLMAEMFAKDSGCCKGMGGSLHVADFNVGMLGATGIVGAGIPIATGAGVSIQLKGSDQVVVSFFGDGASNQGTFHEGINMAAVWKLPVIFVCENNLYGVSTRITSVLPIKNVAERACAYGIPGITVDGNNVLEVYEASKKAIERARRGEGPTLLECKTYRHRGHSRFDPATYRSKEEEDEWRARDPIPKFKKYLLEENIASGKEIDDIEKQVETVIDNSVEFARESADPAPDSALRYTYREEIVL